jgi:hypothetical protein
MVVNIGLQKAELVEESDESMHWFLPLLKLRFRRLGGLGRTINGTCAEYTRAPASNVALIESDLSWTRACRDP